MARSRFAWFCFAVLLAIGVLVIIIYVRKQKLLNLLLPEMTEITLVKGEIRSDTAFISVDAVVKNKAPYDMNIDSIVCELSLGGKTLISTSQYVGIRQKSGESDTVNFSVNIPISATRSKIKNLRDQQDSAGVGIHATIVYTGYRLDLNKSKRIEIPIPPQLKVIKTERKDLKLLKKEVEVDLFLEIINHGKNISVDIEDLQYDLKLGNDLATKGKYPKDVFIRPYSSIMLKFPLDFSMQHPGATIMKIWTDNDRVPYRLMLSGYLNAGEMKRIPVVLIASGNMELVNDEKKKAEKRRERRHRRHKNK